MIDLHSHILPGLDDGARDLEDSLGIARACVASGVSAVAATPHVRDDHPTTPEQMEHALATLRQEFARHEIPLELYGGAEIATEFLGRLSPQDLRRFGLAGNAQYVLLELPFGGWPLALEAQLAELRDLGIKPVIAHPERSREVQEDPDRLAPLVADGALLQVTAASIDGRLGRRSRAAALELLERDLVYLVASDAHHPDVREAGLADAVAALRHDELAHWLTVGVPSAIVNGAPLPPRPDGWRPSSLRRRLIGRG